MKKLNQKGFTLIELIIVIAIIGILAGFLVMRLGNQSENARNARRSSDMSQIRSAIEMYRAQGGAIVLPALTDRTCTLAATADCALIFTGGATGGLPRDRMTGAVWPQDPQLGSYIFTTATAGNYTIAVSPTATDANKPAAISN